MDEGTICINIYSTYIHTLVRRHGGPRATIPTILSPPTPSGVAGAIVPGRTRVHGCLMRRPRARGGRAIKVRSSICSSSGFQVGALARAKSPLASRHARTLSTSGGEAGPFLSLEPLTLSAFAGEVRAGVCVPLFTYIKWERVCFRCGGLHRRDPVRT